MDFIRYTCARCGAKLESPKELADQTERCPGCGQVNRIPKARQRSEKKSFLRSLFGSSSPPASDAAPAASPAARPSPKAKTSRDSPDATYQIRSVGQDDPESSFGKIHAFCSQCNRVVYVDHALKGRKRPCPHCGKPVRVEPVRWSNADEQELQKLIGFFAQCSYGAGQKDAKQMQLIRSRIQELSNKKACASGRSVDAEFKA